MFHSHYFFVTCTVLDLQLTDNGTAVSTFFPSLHLLSGFPSFPPLPSVSSTMVASTMAATAFRFNMLLSKSAIFAQFSLFVFFAHVNLSLRRRCTIKEMLDEMLDAFDRPLINIGKLVFFLGGNVG